jgi:hypothetical protein
VPLGPEGYRLDNIGSSAACYEVTGYLEAIQSGTPSLVCWNFGTNRTIAVNGVSVTCAPDPGLALTMAPRAGGYCIEVGAGDYDFAGFTLPVPAELP